MGWEHGTSHLPTSDAVADFPLTLLSDGAKLSPSSADAAGQHYSCQQLHDLMTLRADDYAGHQSESQSDAGAAAGDGYAAADADWLQHSLLHQCICRQCLFIFLLLSPCQWVYHLGRLEVHRHLHETLWPHSKGLMLGLFFFCISRGLGLGLLWDGCGRGQGIDEQKGLQLRSLQQASGDVQSCRNVRPGSEKTGGQTDLQANRNHSGEASSEPLPELGSRLTPEDQRSKGAEQQAGPVQPADCREAVQNGLQAQRQQ
ncbi:MAG: hypothetical protein FRX49_02503 [Trebouxia sp. A1-2]|nr:MAG: hypothetical protein FRX49_02503 [Trebouxia sp. A1-2]